MIYLLFNDLVDAFLLRGLVEFTVGIKLPLFKCEGVLRKGLTSGLVFAALRVCEW